MVSSRSIIYRYASMCMCVCVFIHLEYVVLQALPLVSPAANMTGYINAIVSPGLPHQQEHYHLAMRFSIS